MILLLIKIKKVKLLMEFLMYYMDFVVDLNILYLLQVYLKIMEEKEKWNGHILIPDISTGLALIIVSLLAGMCFSRTVDGGFVFDDMEAVVNNDDVQLSTPIIDVFDNDFWGTPITHNASHKSYRPLTIISYRLNVLAAGGELRASQFRLVNLALYILVCCLSLFVARSLCGQSEVSLITAVLFTVHPVHSEAVAPVVGRADLLCATFMFFAFLVYCRALDNNTKLSVKALFLSLTVVLAAISMFTKEQGITILPICSAYDFLIFEKKHPRILLRLSRIWSKFQVSGLVIRQMVLLIAATALFMLRWWIMGGTVPIFQNVDNPASFLDSLPLRALNYVYIYALNVWLLVCPEWLCFDWSMGCVPLILAPNDSRVLIAITFSTVFCILLFSLLKNDSGEARKLLMALTFMIVPFLPASNLFFRVGFVIAERSLFVPSLGFCLIVALGVRKLTGMKIWQLTISSCLVLLMVVFCVRSYFRTMQWGNERALFESALSVCPLNAKVHYNLAKTSSDLTEAMDHYKDALRLNPEYDQAMNNLANILKDLGQLSEAQMLLRRALQLRPEFAAAWMNLGIVLSHQKQFTEAEQCYWKAIKHRRNYPDCFYNLGNLYLEVKEHSKAYETWRQATQLDPRHHAAWNNLIIMLDSIGKHTEASLIGQEALTHLPNSPAIHFNVANSLGKTNDFPEAERHFKTAIQLNPKYPLYYVNLGVLYHHWKKFGLAKKMYLQALTLDPNIKSARNYLRLLN
uniref:dolichyl-phosphate-mannose--protein mannosyltransferase n=1 Tax=Graphocephala atropunctata TaxID=36148 RepID=A0A1B6KLG0_9HEMI